MVLVRSGKEKLKTYATSLLLKKECIVFLNFKKTGENLVTSLINILSVVCRMEPMTLLTLVRLQPTVLLH